MRYYSEECWGYPEKESHGLDEYAFDTEADAVRFAVIKAFKDWPLNSDQRCHIIMKALDRLDSFMENYYSYYQGEKGKLLLLYAGIGAAVNMGERDTVDDGISDYIGFWRNKLP